MKCLVRLTVLAAALFPLVAFAKDDPVYDVVVYGGTSSILIKRTLTSQPTRWTRVQLANGWVCNVGTFLNGRAGPAWCADPSQRAYVLNQSWTRKLMGLNPWRSRW